MFSVGSGEAAWVGETGVFTVGSGEAAWVVSKAKVTFLSVDCIFSDSGILLRISSRISPATFLVWFSVSVSSFFSISSYPSISSFSTLNMLFRMSSASPVSWANSSRRLFLSVSTTKLSKRLVVE